MTVTVSGPPPDAAKKDPAQLAASYREVRKKISCVEAERIMYVFNELHRRLLLLAGFASVPAEQFKQFPESCHILRKAAQEKSTPAAELKILTRNALRDVSKDANLCSLIRSSKSDARLESLASLIDELRSGMVDRLTMTQKEEENREMYIRKSNQRLKEIVTQTQKERANENRNAEQRKKTLIEAIKPLEVDLKKLVVEHREVELNLRSKKFRIENEVENWIAKYDDFMIEKQQQLEEVQDAYDEEKEQLDELKERFAILKVDYDAIMEERRLKREQEERERKEFEDKTFNATVIQAFFRSYKVRKLMKGKKKKGGKGKGKKGK
ncbi:Oidioi.mRNA.OKI2018_I69.chr2.g6008.t1.cds [Oikopleura dioica]|uniref:Dynein regulatory complex protein 10 n=1 Tax=Oikopleura dioica TaxID=34765 RepID=A0ABN7T5K3_OIKDI|nr:Oidioi.mRNA.OKI2018_I69.chr2.g6008.t1.cds [Oikopleura dioica]